MKDFKKIEEMVNYIFTAHEEECVEACYEEAPAWTKFDDCFDVNDYVKNEFADREIELNYWNVKEFCRLYCEKQKYYEQLNEELNNADE